MIRASRNWIKLKTLLNSDRRSSIIRLGRSVKGLGAIESETRLPSVEEISETSSPLSTPPTTTDGKTHRHCISRSLSRHQETNSARRPWLAPTSKVRLLSRRGLESMVLVWAHAIHRGYHSMRCSRERENLTPLVNEIRTACTALDAHRES